MIGEIVAALMYACNTSTADSLNVLSYASHKANINSNKPMIAKINWYVSGGNHVVVVMGFDDSSNYLKLVDPWMSSPTTKYTYSSLIAGTNIQSGTNGRYIITFVTQ